MSEGKKQIDVAAALILRAGKILIAQRHEDSHLGGFWEFPGGKREPNETFEACLVREIREELGVEISVGKLLSEITHDYTDKTVSLKFFICRLIRSEPQALGCKALKWVGESELNNHEFLPADARLIRELKTSPDFPD